MLLLVAFAVTAFADYEDGEDCPVCGHYHWDDHRCDVCGACSEECDSDEYQENTAPNAANACWVRGTTLTVRNAVCAKTAKRIPITTAKPADAAIFVREISTVNTVFVPTAAMSAKNVNPANTAA